MTGVSFQPGIDDERKRREQQNGGQTGNVQEAIKVLSLRLPKVVGAQGVSPSALLTSPGGMGQPDAVVDRILSRLMPTSPQAPQGMTPSAMPSPPQSGGMSQIPSIPMLPGPQRQGPSIDYAPRRNEPAQPVPPPRLPHIIVGPDPFGNEFLDQNGRPFGPVPGAVQPAPDDLFEILRRTFRGGDSAPPDATPMF